MTLHILHGFYDMLAAKRAKKKKQVFTSKNLKVTFHKRLLINI